MNLWIITYDTGQGPPFNLVPVFSDEYPGLTLVKTAIESQGDDWDEVDIQEVNGPWAQEYILKGE